MSTDTDLLVVGGGPAGVEAALAAAGHGCIVTLVDEASQAGGQVYRAQPSSFSNTPSTPESRAGDDLRRRLAASQVRGVFAHTVWSVSPGFRVDALGPDGPRSWRARAVVVATGAQERVVPFPGWTLPGVMGLAGATILLKSQRMVPGRRTLVAGCGPLLLAVAAGVLKAGGEVAAVIDLSSRADWLRSLPDMLGCPDLVARGAGWLLKLRSARVPLLARHGIRLAEPAPRGGLRVTVGPVDHEGRPDPDGAARIFEADAVAVGHGLTPSTDVTRLLRADHLYDAMRGGWMPRVDADFRTSVAGLYAVGDGAGIVGAAAAALDARLAGLAVARDLGALSAESQATQATSLRLEARRARRFGGAMARVMALRPAQVLAIPPETVICRCEDVTRVEIDGAVAEGLASVNQLKAWTRCGMGPCQGRICGDVVGTLLAGRDGQRDAVGFFTGRSPFRPLPLDQLAGRCDYADIRLPPPAPL